LRFFVISSYLTTTNTREAGPVLTILNHFHPFPSGPLAQNARERGWATYFVARSKRGWPISPEWFMAGAALGVGAYFHDAGPGSNAKTSVHRTAVKPTGRLRRAAADVARETFRTTCSPTCAEKSTGTNKSSPQEQAGNDFPEFSQSRTKLRQRLLTLPPRRPNDRSPARTPAGDLRSGRRRGCGDSLETRAEHPSTENQEVISGPFLGICHLPSAIRHLPFGICHLPSAIRHLPFGPCATPLRSVPLTSHCPSTAPIRSSNRSLTHPARKRYP